MYKTNLFYHYAEVNDNHFVICFWPDFRQDIALFNENNDYYASDNNRIEKKKELRLYFYNGEKGRLHIVESEYYFEETKYSLSRPFNRCSIDREFHVPSQSCFILGRVKKTIGTKSGYLHDFIE